jgi:D-aminopeptidase
MNIYIMTDIEGISGIYTRDQVVPGSSRFGEGRDYMTRDINACVEACKAAGAEKVFVRDCHGGSYSVLWDKLSPLADYYICGDTGEDRFCGVAECDGVILLGYHAMAGTFAGVLEHSMSSVRIQNYYINGIPSGEVAIDAGILGDMGKPVIMVSGDDKVCAETKGLLPWAVTAEVKKGTGTYGAMLLPMEKAHKLIYDKTVEAVKSLQNAKPLVFEKPIHFWVELAERNSLPGMCGKNYIRIIDGRTFETVGDTMKEAFFRSL